MLHVSHLAFLTRRRRVERCTPFRDAFLDTRSGIAEDQLDSWSRVFFFFFQQQLSIALRPHIEFLDNPRTPSKDVLFEKRLGCSVLVSYVEGQLG